MTDAVSTSLSGLTSALQRMTDASSKIAGASAAPVNVDEELIGMKLASVSYSANVTMLKAELDNEKKLLDILA